jgi:hypothetical protein
MQQVSAPNTVDREYKTAVEKYFGSENTVVRIKETNRYKYPLMSEMRKKLADYSDEELIEARRRISAKSLTAESAEEFLEIRNRPHQSFPQFYGG